MPYESPFGKSASGGYKSMFQRELRKKIELL